MKMVLAEDIYADLSPDWEPFKDLFSRYRRESKIEGIYLSEAFYPDNFQYGLTIIRKWLRDKALRIEHGSILQEQLGKIPKGDLGGHPEVDYYAVAAACNVITSYEVRSGGHMTAEEAQKLYEMYAPPSAQSA